MSWLLDAARDGGTDGFERKIRDTTFTFRSRTSGDDYFEVLYADAREAQKQATHYSVVCGRAKPFRPELYNDVLAIQKALIGPDGKPPELHELFTLYDKDPWLFSQLRGAALEALGIIEDLVVYSGKTGWENAYRAMRAARRAIQEGKDIELVLGKLGPGILAAARAIDELGGSEADDIEPLDQVMADFFGEPTAESTQEPDSESSTGPGSQDSNP